jgi:hypothetical protein
MTLRPAHQSPSQLPLQISSFAAGSPRSIALQNALWLNPHRRVTCLGKSTAPLSAGGRTARRASGASRDTIPSDPVNEIVA